MNKLPKTYCRKPFDTATITPTGRMQLCCDAKHDFTFPAEKRAITEFKNLDEWFNSDYMNRIRKQMLDGKPLKECAACYLAEGENRTSTRTATNKKYFENNSDLLEYSLKDLDIKFGNKCNLKCKMCFPFASSELWKEWKDLGWNSKEKDPNNDTSWKYYDDYFEEDYNWPNNDVALNNIKEHMKYTRLLHVTGGEPMINPKMFAVLRYCINNNYAKNIILEITTNATKIHPKFFDIAKQFKQINLTVSVDGIDKCYEYIRYPGNYKKVYANILKYHSWIKNSSNKNNSLCFNFVLQIWNLHQLADYIKTFNKLSIDYNQIKRSSLEVLFDPTFMTFNMLPQELIRQAVSKIVALQKNGDPGVQLNTRYALDIIHGAVSRPIQSDQWKKLKQFVKAQDTYRGINIEDYIPHLAKFVR